MKERLYELARQDRQWFETLERPSGRTPSVADPIEATVLRIRNALYCALAAGAGLEAAFADHYEQARVACERYNAAQEAATHKSWHNTDTGYFSPDEAWQRLRHAVKMYQQMQTPVRNIHDPAYRAQLANWPHRVCRNPARIAKKQRWMLRRLPWLRSIDWSVWQANRMYLWSAVRGRMTLRDKQRETKEERA